MSACTPVIVAGALLAGALALPSSAHDDGHEMVTVTETQPSVHKGDCVIVEKEWIDTGYAGRHRLRFVKYRNVAVCELEGPEGKDKKDRVVKIVFGDGTSTSLSTPDLEEILHSPIKLEEANSQCRSGGRTLPATTLGGPSVR